MPKGPGYPFQSFRRDNVLDFEAIRSEKDFHFYPYRKAKSDITVSI